MNKTTIAVMSTFIVLVAGLAIFLSWAIEEPLKDYLLKKANGSLKDYQVDVKELNFHPLSLSLELTDLRLTQQNHPDPPVARIQIATAGLSWKALFSGRLVAECHLEKPAIRIDMTQIREEASDDVPLENKGWRQISWLTPLEINHFSAANGEILYLQKGEGKPLVIDDIVVDAKNIQSIHDVSRPFPSEIAVSARVFGKGKIRFTGHADFLSPSGPSIKGDLDAENIPLDGLTPVLKKTPVSIDGGTIDSISLQIKIRDAVKQVHVSEARIHGLKSNYVFSRRKKALLTPAQQAAVKEEVASSPIEFRMDKFFLTEANIGLINKTTDPSYRIFVGDARFRVENFSNGFEMGPAVIRLKGMFMGSGDTAVYGTFRPETNGPDFDVQAAIRNTSIPDMNALLKAYAGLDAAAGKFSLFSEISVHDQRIHGYVKPMFHHMEIYSEKQDQSENLFQQIYEGAAGALSSLLESEPKEIVATRTDLSGDLDNPKADTWEAVVNLVRNAFFDAILPGFTQNISF